MADSIDEEDFFNANKCELYQIYCSLNNELNDLGIELKITFEVWWQLTKAMTTLVRGREDGPGALLHQAQLKRAVLARMRELGVRASSKKVPVPTGCLSGGFKYWS